LTDLSKVFTISEGNSLRGQIMAYTIGLDYGTNSVRALLVDVANGDELGTAVYEYETGEAGIILDSADHNLARQNPVDYLKGIEVTIQAAIAQARKADRNFDAKEIIGIGIDTTGSTPIPVDEDGTPLSMLEPFKNNPNACAWLWKDHTGHVEAAEITELAQKEHPEYLAKCGGTYSSEWFFSKVLHCLRTDPAVFDAAYSWVELCSTASGAGCLQKNSSQNSIQSSENSARGCTKKPIL
jgi:L-ribulokinase